MPTIKENLNVWSSENSWTQDGEAWSAHWGGAEAQWWGSILPRVHSFIPTQTILEIAPGYGRWTHYLKDMCQKLIIVDLTEGCIQKCKLRFRDDTHISYFVNDGKSLDFLEENSVDFVFSFDSLVHAEPEVIESYLKQLAKILKPNGVGFFHHSNLGEYTQYLSTYENIIDKITKLLQKLNPQQRQPGHWRDVNMKATLFEKFCSDCGLDCISQEIINWSISHPIDCMSLFTPQGSTWSRLNCKIVNRNFMDEGKYISNLSRLYCSSKLSGKNST